MKGGFAACLAWTLRPENDGQPFHVTAGDPGGATSWGVTRASWARWSGCTVSLEAMQDLTAASVGGIYQAWYWNTISGDSLPRGVDLMVFDNGVLSGEVVSAQQLQRIVGVDVDGDIGPLTLAAVGKIDPVRLIGDLAAAQEARYRSLVGFSRFGNGWLARLNRRTAAALAMARGVAV